MSSVIVVRFEGDKEGEPIVETLATSLAVLRQRGRRELDELSLDGLEKTIRVPYDESVAIGDIVMVDAQSSGRSMVGKVTTVDHSLGQAQQYTDLQIRGVIV